MEKRIILLVLCFISIITIAQEQIEIYLHESDTEVSGTVIDITNGEVNMEQNFDIKNVSGESLALRITRKKIIELADTQDYLCWETNCYIPTVVSASNPWTSPDMENITDGAAGFLSTHHRTKNNSGCAQYRYYVINESDELLDSVDVKFCSTVSIVEEIKDPILVYPNPATDFVKIVSTGDFSNLEFHLVNVLGKQVLTAELVENIQILNLDYLPNGTYFYSIIKNGEIMETKKLVLM